MQVLFVSIVSTVMHAHVNQTVDVILSGFLLFGEALSSFSIFSSKISGGSYLMN